jgi:O-antigen ligase
MWFSPIKIQGYSPRISILFAISLLILFQLVRNSSLIEKKAKAIIILCLSLPFMALPTLFVTGSDILYHFFRLTTFVVLVPITFFSIKNYEQMHGVNRVLFIGVLFSCFVVFLQAFDGSFYRIHQFLFGEYYAYTDNLAKFIQDDRPFGLSSQSIVFGYDILPIFGIIVALTFSKTEHPVNRYYISFLLFVTSTAIFLNETRSVILALIIGVPFYMLKVKKVRRMKVLIMSGVLVLGVIISLDFINTGENRLFNIEDASSLGRVGMYLTGLYAVIENPIFGLGPDSKFILEDFLPQTSLDSRYLVNINWGTGSVHNNYLFTLLSYGLPFFLTLIIIIYLVFKLLWHYMHDSRRGNYSKITASGLILGMMLYLIDIFFHNGGPATHAFWWFFIGYATALTRIYPGEKHMRIING